jgi:hypothetical protein
MLLCHELWRCYCLRQQRHMELFGTQKLPFIIELILEKVGNELFQILLANLDVKPMKILLIFYFLALTPP